MNAKEIEAHIRAIYAAVGAPDAYRAAFADTVAWHVPGDNPVSGLYRGAAAYFDLMPSRMAPLDEWRFTITGVEVNEGDRAALVAFHLVGQRKGRRLATTGHHMIRLDEAGRVIEGWGFTANQAALDALFAG